MVLRGLFGGNDPKTSDQPEAVPAQSQEFATESIRRIAGEIEALPIEERRFIAEASDELDAYR